jgi:hypothetical protein
MAVFIRGSGSKTICTARVYYTIKMEILLTKVILLIKIYYLCMRGRGGLKFFFKKSNFK